MNTEQKNIETCLAESVLAEVANVPTDPQFVSLVDESLDQLKQQAAAQTGYEDYEKVVWQHKPYTFTSQVAQMKSNLILLLRRLWRFPFGRGASRSLSDDGSSDAGSLRSLSDAGSIRSLADMWSHYIPRLSGNAEYGIPSRLAQLTDLPSAPLLLSDRKISGIPEAHDGMSMVRILCDSAYAATITEITDDTTGWTLTKNNIMATIRSLFPNIAKIKLGFKESVGVVFGAAPDDTDLSELEHIQYNGSAAADGITWISKNGDLHLPKLKDFYANQRGAIIFGDKLNGSFIAEEIETISGGWDGQFINTYRMPRFYAPKLRKLTGGAWHGSSNLGASSVGSTDLLTEVIVGYGSVFSHAHYLLNRPNVIKVEFRVTADTNVNLAGWNPTNVLADQDLLQQFLSNFKTYIAERLTDQGAGKTITLSQAVRNAIHAAEDTYHIENIIITQKGWTISPAPN